MKIKLLSLAIAASIAPVSHSALGQHSDLHTEEITIISLPLAPTASDSSQSAEVLTGEQLRASISSTLGDSLKQIPGVIGAGFGAGASAPVIRGQSGSRVSVLQDGLGLSDAAALSPDHANAVEPALATRIEVIRGPATLLYGNGAIGGVVNVIDKRIPTELADELVLEQRFDTNNDGSTTVISADKQLGSFAAHFDASLTSTDDISIPGYASLESEEEHEEHEGEEEHDDDHDEESRGVLENSDIENSQFSLGGSYVSDSGFVGASVTVQEKDYGLPEGAHAHEEEGEEGEMHDEEEHGEEEEIVRIELDSKRFAVKANYQFDSFWKELDAHLSVTDYEHQEIENGEAGTRFQNDSVELRGLVKHAHSDTLSGVIGTQILSSDFSAIGSESFIPKTENTSFALFTVQSYDTDHFLYEAGLRVEQQDYSTSQCDRDFLTYSASASSLWRANESNNIIATFAHSERAPTTEELFSNLSESACATEADESLWVEHLATGRIELGNPDLDTETSNNLELAWRKFQGPFQFEVGTYYNQIDSYTYLSDRHEDEEHEEGEPEQGVEEHEHEGEIISDYVQEDARFIGFELKALSTLELDSAGHIDFELFADRTRALLDSDEQLPRIPAARTGASIGLNTNKYAIQLNATHSFEQDDVAEGERVTESYTELSIYADYHANFGNGNEWVVFARGENLLDEEIRNHASFTKDFAPERGIGLILGLRVAF